MDEIGLKLQILVHSQYFHYCTMCHFDLPRGIGSTCISCRQFAFESHWLPRWIVKDTDIIYLTGTPLPSSTFLSHFVSMILWRERERFWYTDHDTSISYMPDVFSYFVNLYLYSSSLDRFIVRKICFFIPIFQDFKHEPFNTEVVFKMAVVSSMFHFHDSGIHMEMVAQFPWKGHPSTNLCRLKRFVQHCQPSTGS